MFVATLDFPAPGQPNDPGTGAFPRIISIALVLLSVLLFLRPDPVSLVPTRDRALTVVGIIVATAVFGYLLDPLGFLASSLLFMIVALLLMGVRRPLPLVLVTLGITFGLYYLFAEALSVFLPSGYLEDLVP